MRTKEELELKEYDIEPLYGQASKIVDSARSNAFKQIDFLQILTNLLIGKQIVEDEQQGSVRAKYGKSVLKKLTIKLTEKYGRGFSVDNLESMRKFYLKFGDIISESTLRKLYNAKSESMLRILGQEEVPYKLTWTHYLILMRIENRAERDFYEIEAFNERWDYRTLQRQYNSSLYESLAVSRNKDSVLQLSCQGNVVERLEDLLKQPTIMEFLGLEEKSEYVESDLEAAIIDKLQAFLMEMGEGFLFEKRQKRFTFDEDNYYVDLVLYNRLLRCYVLIDLKVDTLTHQDLGQMQMYVNYYDREVRTEFENPTIGILLCKENKEAMVKLTLPPDANIYASEYKLYLPDKKLLQEKLKEWIEEADTCSDIHRFGVLQMPMYMLNVRRFYGI